MIMEFYSPRRCNEKTEIFLCEDGNEYICFHTGWAKTIDGHLSDEYVDRFGEYHYKRFSPEEEEKYVRN